MHCDGYIITASIHPREWFKRISLKNATEHMFHMVDGWNRPSLFAPRYYYVEALDMSDF